MIKFEIRRNLKYPLQYLLWTLLRESLIMIIRAKFDLSGSVDYIQFMFLGEFFVGGIIHLYLQKIMPKRSEKKDQYFMSIKLIKSEENDNDYFIPIDNKKKIIVLIFIASFFDAVSFLLDAVITPKFKTISPNLNIRLYGIATLSASFTYVFTLKLPVYWHHKFSLSIIGLCLIVVIVTEYFFQTIDLEMTYGKLTMAIVCIIISQVLISCQDLIEKYLFEYNYMNPFVVLMYEGLFGFLLTFFCFFLPDYFQGIIKIYNANLNFALFIFLLFVYTILSGFKNIFRVVTIKIYSPITKILADYIINPLYFPYYYLVLKDFRNKDKSINIAYLTLNIIIAFIISFFGCVFGEFIILFCCKLSHDTHHQISERASSYLETELVKLEDNIDNNPIYDITIHDNSFS